MLFSNMADNEFGLTDSEMAQLMNEVADCLGPDPINELMSEVTPIPLSPQPTIPQAPTTSPQGEYPKIGLVQC